MRTSYMRSRDGFLFVYSIVSPDTVEQVRKLHTDVLRIKGSQSQGESIPMIVVGNKVDLVNERKVPREEGEKIAKEWGCPFFETSAKEGVNVTEAFHELVRRIKRARNPSQQEKASCCVIL